MGTEQKVTKRRHDSKTGSVGLHKRRATSQPDNSLRINIFSNETSSTTDSFALQAYALAAETVVSKEEAKSTSVRYLLEQLQKCFANLETGPQLTLKEWESELYKTEPLVTVPFPLPRPPQDSPLSFQFYPPVNVELIGPAATGAITLTKEKTWELDIAVTIPSKCFQDKDYRDCRYFYKRAIYLAHLVKQISQTLESKIYDIFYENMDDDARRPIIRIWRRGKKEHRLGIRIIPCIPLSTFLDAKLLQHRCNIRKENNFDLPTPYYNNTLLAEESVGHSNTATIDLLNKVPNFAIALVLGRIWLQQRGLDSGINSGGFGYYEWQEVLACLLTSRTDTLRLPMDCSVVQIFSVGMKLLEQILESSNPTYTTWNGNVSKPHYKTPYMRGFSEKNIFYKLQPHSTALLLTHVKKTVTALDTYCDFRQIFVDMANYHFLTYDTYISWTHSVDSEDRKKIENRDFQSVTYQIVDDLYFRLKLCLEKRCRVIAIDVRQTTAWPIGVIYDNMHADTLTIGIGLIIDPDFAFLRVIRGPPVNQHESVKLFQEFWGEEAEIRKFQDGSILHCVVWPANSTAGQENITDNCLHHIVKRFFRKKSIDFQPNFKERFLTYRYLTAQISEHSMYQEAINGFEHLSKLLSKLEDMPLKISSVVPVFLSLNCIPTLKSNPDLLDPLDVVLKFESSNRWSNNWHALQKMKSGFLLHIRNLLSDSDVLSHILIGREVADTDVELSYLDLKLAKYVYRIRIYVQIEFDLIERAIKKPLPSIVKDKMIKLQKYYHQLYIHRPAHVSGILDLHTKHPSLVAAIALLRHFMLSQYLFDHISLEAIELLVASVYVDSDLWFAPACPISGFLRSLLRLARFDWPNECKNVDLNKGKVDSVKNYKNIKSAIKLEFSKPQFILLTNYDSNGTIWTEDAPSKLMAARISHVAAAAFNFLTTFPCDIKPIFNTSWEDFDFCIRITKIDGAKSGNNQSKNPFSSVSHNPIFCFYRELKTLYHDICIFLYNPLQNIIAGVWLVGQDTLKKWRGQMDYPTKPRLIEEEVYALLDRDAIYKDIEMLGYNLIETIEVLK